MWILTGRNGKRTRKKVSLLFFSFFLTFFLESLDGENNPFSLAKGERESFGSSSSSSAEKKTLRSGSKIRSIRKNRGKKRFWLRFCEIEFFFYISFFFPPFSKAKKDRKKKKISLRIRINQPTLIFRGCIKSLPDIWHFSARRKFFPLFFYTEDRTLKTFSLCQRHFPTKKWIFERMWLDGCCFPYHRKPRKLKEAMEVAGCACLVSVT